MDDLMTPLERKVFDIWVDYFEGRITQSRAHALEALAVDESRELVDG